MIIKKQFIGDQEFRYSNLSHNNYQLLDNSKNKLLFCILNIKIDLITYESQKQFYDISYTWRYSENLDNSPENPALKLHPLYFDKQFINHHNEGEIIYKNILSDKLVELLLLPLDELNKHSGNVSEFEYQKSLLKIITTLWD